MSSSAIEQAGTEYRVRWQREGRGQTTKIFQRHESAWRKARGILALEAVKADTSFHAMPDLVSGPGIESRPVGAWESVDFQPTDLAIEDGAKEAMAEWAEWANPRERPVMSDVPF